MATGIPGGGAIYAYYGATTLTNCTVRGNSAVHSTRARGGAISTTGGSGLVLTNCTVSFNSTSTASAGAHGTIYARYNDVDITASTISSNVGDGLVAYLSDDVRVVRSTVNGNAGAGVVSDGVATVLELRNTTVSGNSSSGVYRSDYGDAMALLNCTITCNGSEGLVNGTNPATMRNTLVAGNGSSSDLRGQFSSLGLQLDRPLELQQWRDRLHERRQRRSSRRTAQPADRPVARAARAQRWPDLDSCAAPRQSGDRRGARDALPARPTNAASHASRRRPTSEPSRPDPRRWPSAPRAPRTVACRRSGGSGVPSASAPTGFTITVSRVEGQKQGLVFYGINNGFRRSRGGRARASCASSRRRSAPSCRTRAARELVRRRAVDRLERVRRVASIRARRAVRRRPPRVRAGLVPRSAEPQAHDALRRSLDHARPVRS